MATTESVNAYRGRWPAIATLRGDVGAGARCLGRCLTGAAGSAGTARQGRWHYLAPRDSASSPLAARPPTRPRPRVRPLAAHGRSSLTRSSTHPAAPVPLRDRPTGPAGVIGRRPASSTHRGVGAPVRRTRHRECDTQRQQWRLYPRGAVRVRSGGLQLGRRSCGSRGARREEAGPSRQPPCRDGPASSRARSVFLPPSKAGIRRWAP